MPVHTVELLRAAEIVAEKKQLKAAVKYSLAGAGLTCATTLIGGLIGGPVGLFAGAVIGGGTSMAATKGKFKSVVSIIRDDLTEAQKRKLCAHLINALKDVHVTDLIGLASIVMREEALMFAVTRGLTQFMESEMHMRIA